MPKDKPSKLSKSKSTEKSSKKSEKPSKPSKSSDSTDSNDKNDIKAPHQHENTVETPQTQRITEDEDVSFKSMGLDQRLLKSIDQMGFVKPSLVQATAIPLALKGKDVLANARTGSGKTLAYLLPILQKILSMKKEQQVHAVILVPTKELADQVHRNIKSLTTFCSKEVSVLNLSSSDVDSSLQKPLIANKPDIVVSTPSRIIPHLDSIDFSHLHSLAIDEADLLLSFGYEDDLSKILDKLPKIYQSFLLSATVTSDVNRLKQLILRNPAVLKLHEEEQDSKLTEYQIPCPTDQDKFLLIYFLLKLKVVPFGNSRTIVYVNDVDGAYRLRLFLEQFGVRTCVLDSSLPLKSRLHVIAEFNRGVYDYIIATDDGELDEGGRGNLAADDDDSGKSKKKKKKDKESSASRGLDFHKVSAVINFDVPPTVRSYVHRLGRTARGVGNDGYALTLVGKNDSMDKIQEKLSKDGRSLQTFTFDWSQVDGFRYRVSDGLRAVTKTAVREARLKEIKQELLNSEKLKAHFEDKKVAVRHDKPLHPARVQQHMKTVPEYLLPGKRPAEEIGFVSYKSDNKRKRPNNRGGRGGNNSRGRGQGKKQDALSNFGFL